VIGISSVGSTSTGLHGSPQSWIVLGAMAVAFMLLLATASMGRSSHPSQIWCVLTSPSSMESFAMAPVRMLRVVLVIPATALLAAFLLWKSSGPLPLRPLPALAAGALWENVLMFLRGFTPTLPFSQSFKSVRRTGWLRIVMGLYMTFVLGIAVVLLGVAGFIGPVGYAALIVVAAAARVGLGVWVRHRLRRESEQFELSDWAA